MVRLGSRFLAHFMTLRWRLTLLNAALLTVLGIGLGVFIYFRLESYLYESLRSRMQDYAVTQTQTTSTRNDGKSGGDGDGRGNGGKGGSDTLTLSDLAKLLATKPSGEIHPVVLDSSGQPVIVTTNPSTTTSAVVVSTPATTSTATISATAASPTYIPFGASLPTTEQLQQAARAGGIFYITTSNRDSYEQLQVYLAVVKTTSNGNQTGASSGYIMLVATLKPSTEVLREIEFLLIIGLSGIFVLIILSGYPLTKLGLRPLKKIANTARQLRVSRLDQRVPLPNSLLTASASGKLAKQDEVWQLVLEFNAMLDKIEKAFLAQQRNEAQMRQFVADASHELRTPLTILGGYLDVLQMGATNDPHHNELIISSLKQEIDRLSRLVIDLLMLTRLDSREPVVSSLAPLDLGELLGRTTANMRILAESRNVKLNFDTQEGIWVNGNGDELYRVFANLLDNAIRYSPSGGTVQLALATEGNSNQCC